MSEIQSDRDGVSRRSVLLGLGAAAGAAAAVSVLPVKASAAPSSLPAWSPAVPEAVGAAISGLTYIGIDAEQFFPTAPTQRQYDVTEGTHAQRRRNDSRRVVAAGRLDDLPGQHRVSRAADPDDLQANAPAAGEPDRS